MEGLNTAFMIELFSDPQTWIALATLTAMEIVLGIDNVVFISILVSKLPKHSAESARRIGIALALVFRILLLFVLTWIMGLTVVLFELYDHAFSWRDLILIGGGLFLIYKATGEIHEEIEPETSDQDNKAIASAFAAIVMQIIAIDLVFSVDSIVTAIGMVDDVEVMIIAVVLAVGVIFYASGPIAEFVRQHPTTKMLALSFLLLIGVSLVADGLGFHIPRGYIYFAMAFSALVEIFNVLVGRRKNRFKP